MSVQVRRRREAAGFLASFVGAQGELLVDTTNSRVQVHDGATPGGWPAAGIADLPGRNVLVNGAFGVNQRAYASGTALAPGAYAHDRWKAGAGGCAYAFTQSVPDTLVTIAAAGSLMQMVEAANVTASSFWLSWTGTAPARVWQGGPSGAMSPGTQAKVGGIAVNTLFVGGLTIGTIVGVEFGTGTLGLVQLEAALPNAGPTRYERRHPGQELALCQRYFQRWTQPPLRGTGGPGWAYRMGMPIPIMRATPALTMNGNLLLWSGKGATTRMSAISNTICSPGAIEIDAGIQNTGAFAAGDVVLVLQEGGTANSLDLSAEL